MTSGREYGRGLSPELEIIKRAVSQAGAPEQFAEGPPGEVTAPELGRERQPPPRRYGHGGYRAATKLLALVMDADRISSDEILTCKVLSGKDEDLTTLARGGPST